ncbi:CPBP family intramembrane metalloprotease [Epidermidibacterium keratini]|uniref:CPBP family intramembrane metalloprotease n=1 Tax=Epidermidibacterium keratini TaxID=1891644 RepID=A0A7L4YK01_9ACTN|nr:CPBP family intramembrane glutamic endopeptidase [Epidermidibacterium keratini]QHB99128.1 CPBP family intramembrane metalloprotease [Epidermidibacterium keratini]
MIDRGVLPSGIEAFGTATAAALILGVYLVAAEPFVGMVLHRRFESAPRRWHGARLWLYRRLLLLEWGLAALCVATVVLAPSVGLASIGLRLPDGALGWGISLAAIAGALLALVLTARQIASAPDDLVLPPASPSLVAMLPRTPVERRLFGLVSITAGVCEEIAYRGFLTALVAALLPVAPVWVCAVIAAVAFGFAHLYQGTVGLVGTLLVGLVLAGLYVVSGSLLAPIVVHALIDLRAIPLGRIVAREAQKGRDDGRGD